MILTLALGTNLGDRHQILADTRRLIGERIGPVINVSSIIETKAWGVEDQPDFLNQVIVVDGTAFGGTVLSSGTASSGPPASRGEGAVQSSGTASSGPPDSQGEGAAAGAGNVSVRAMLHRLLDLTQGIEADLGRERKTHWGPRTCDIDIIFVDDLRYEDERISLPHPWWREREFVAGLIQKNLEVRF